MWDAKNDAFRQYDGYMKLWAKRAAYILTLAGWQIVTEAHRTDLEHSLRLARYSDLSGNSQLIQNEPLAIYLTRIKDNERKQNTTPQNRFFPLELWPDSV